MDSRLYASNTSNSLFNTTLVVTTILVSRCPRLWLQPRVLPGPATHRLPRSGGWRSVTALASCGSVGRNSLIAESQSSWEGGREGDAPFGDALPGSRGAVMAQGRGPRGTGGRSPPGRPLRVHNSHLARCPWRAKAPAGTLQASGAPGPCPLAQLLRQSPHALLPAPSSPHPPPRARHCAPSCPQRRETPSCPQVRGEGGQAGSAPAKAAFFPLRTMFSKTCQCSHLRGRSGNDMLPLGPAPLPAGQHTSLPGHLSAAPSVAALTGSGPKQRREAFLRLSLWSLSVHGLQVRCFSRAFGDAGGLGTSLTTFVSCWPGLWAGLEVLHAEWDVGREGGAHLAPKGPRGESPPSGGQQSLPRRRGMEPSSSTGRAGGMNRSGQCRKCWEGQIPS